MDRINTQNLVDTMDVSGFIWPVDQSKIVRFTKGTGRGFGDRRSNGARYHAGCDLYAPRKTKVFAVTYGRIVNYYPFYKSGTYPYDYAYCLMINYGHFVMNHGEILRDLPKGISVGTIVKPGDLIGYLSSCNMQHTEIYCNTETRNKAWYKGSGQPSTLCDPTTFLINLAKSNGVTIA